MSDKIDVVTGAFGYIGRYITAELLEAGRQVKTITTYVNKPNPFGSRVRASSYDFENPTRLMETLRGVDTLYNTYWIRFEHRGMTFDRAVENTRILFDCAARAGVRKIVHISVTKASEASPLPYYSGKARQERLLKESDLNYSIVRPTLVFGKEDILVNNIAWLIRTFPIFPVPGGGAYRLQPVYVGDLARIAVDLANEPGSPCIDAIGPETYTYREFVAQIAAAIGKRVTLVNVPPWLTTLSGRVIGIIVGDVILTGRELQGLMDEYLTSSQVANGPTSFSDWLQENRDTVGSTYSSELDRHWRWRAGNDA